MMSFERFAFFGFSVYYLSCSLCNKIGDVYILSIARYPMNSMKRFEVGSVYVYS